MMEYGYSAKEQERRTQFVIYCAERRVLMSCVCDLISHLLDSKTQTPRNPLT
jgi:hypothetical protein